MSGENYSRNSEIEPILKKGGSMLFSALLTKRTLNIIFLTLKF